MAANMLTGWWARRSNPARFELYTRWSLYSFSFVEVVIGASAGRGVGPRWAVLTVALLLVAHAVVVAVTCRLSLDWVLGRRPRPRAQQAATLGLAATIGVLLLGLRAADVPQEPFVSGPLLTLSLGSALMAVTLAMPGRRAAGAVGLTALGVAALSYLVTGAPAETLVYAASCTIGGAFFVGTGRISVWMLGVVAELDAARHVQARLAVAEERLRFGRDLHDVLGRNLSVIALKSELAVQLAQRGRDSALDEMVEVQRIARESQQELREVVRGYREAGLRTELAGAGSVLRAAGIECEIDTEPAERLPEAVQSALGWVVREAATNVLRHADATRCTIRLRLDGAEAVLTVTNDGVPTGRPGSAGGNGLSGLRERLADLGGTLTAGPAPAVGVPEAARPGGSAGPGAYELRAEVPVSGVRPGAETELVVR